MDMLLEDIPKPIQIESPRKCKLFGLFDKENEIVCSCDLYSYSRISINDKKEINIKLKESKKIFDFIKFLEKEFEIHPHYKLEVWSNLQHIDDSVYLTIFESCNKFFDFGLSKEDYLKYFPNSFTNLYGGIYYHNKKTKKYNLISKNEFLFIFCDIGKIFLKSADNIEIDYKTIIPCLQREDVELIDIMNNISIEIINKKIVSNKFANIFNSLSKFKIGVKPVIIENKEFLGIFANSENINKIKKHLNGKIIYECFIGVDGLNEFSIF